MEGRKMLATTVTASDMLVVIVLGILLGVVGQFLRLVAELADPESTLNPRSFGINLTTALVIGTAAGGAGAVSFIGKDLEARDVVTLIGVGYVGTDFATQFLKRAFSSLTGS
jgi:hypothetical protein